MENDKRMNFAFIIYLCRVLYDFVTADVGTICCYTDLYLVQAEFIDQQKIEEYNDNIVKVYYWKVSMCFYLVMTVVSNSIHLPILSQLSNVDEIIQTAKLHIHNIHQDQLLRVVSGVCVPITSSSWWVRSRTLLFPPEKNALYINFVLPVRDYTS